MFCARLFICALWSPAGKGLTSWLSFVVSSVSLSLSHWYPGSGVVLDCIDSWSLHHYLLLVRPKLEYAAPIWSPFCKTQIQQVEKVQRTAARWTCRRWRNTSSVGEMLDELQWPTPEARRDQSSLLFFQKIHCGTMSINKTSTWPCLRVQDLPGHHTTHSTAGPRLIVMPWSILFSQGLVWLHL